MGRSLGPADQRRAILKALGCCGALVAAAVLLRLSEASACVPQPLISIQPKSSGPPGTEVTVEGASLGRGAVEIRWNKLDGPTLGKAVGPNLSQPVIIPESPEGLYAVIVVERDPNGGIAASGRAAFQVTGSGASSPSGSSNQGAGEKPAAPNKSSGLEPAVAWGGGAALLLAGGLGGTWLAQRRRRGAAT
jgi:hypothetical protein